MSYLQPILQPILRPVVQAINRGGLPGWSPRSLFAAGEQGAWYDPSDLSTLYQDSAGTTPVTATGQPVGLMLDKRLGLVRGAEVIADPDMTTIVGLTNNGGLSSPFEVVPWQGAATALHVKGGNFSGARIGQTTVGKLYYATARVWVVSGQMYLGDISAKLGGADITTVGQWVTRSGYVFGAGANGFACYSSVAGSEWYMDTLSVRELPGNHASQLTTTARPVLAFTPNRITYDGVDDVLNTTFPAALGSACTVARSVPGVGAQILMNQTIDTALADSTTHCGLLIINRALTPAETQKVTAYLNQKAGV